VQNLTSFEELEVKVTSWQTERVLPGVTVTGRHTYSITEVRSTWEIEDPLRRAISVNTVRCGKGPGATLCEDEGICETTAIVKAINTT